MPNYAYCDICHAVQPVTVEPLTHPDATGRYRGGDTLCTVCGWIICALYRPVEEPEAKALLETPDMGRKCD